MFRRKPPEDGVAIALKQLEQQNAGLVRLAHLFAGMLVVSTSVASLIALAGDIVQAVVQEIRTHPDQLRIPILASIIITFLLVLAMDTGMLLAAGQIRVKLARKAALGAMAFDLVIMIGVACLEAGTYCYMLWQYEHPANQLAGVLIIARAIAVPLLSMYLVMARPVAVMPADILALAALAAGTGFLRDVADIASNKRLPTSATRRKLRLFAAAAQLNAPQRKALVDMLHAAEDTEGEDDDLLLDATEVVKADIPRKQPWWQRLRGGRQRSPVALLPLATDPADEDASDDDDDADVTAPPKGNRRRTLAAVGTGNGHRESHGRQ